jgi:hypothetical protein
MVKGQIWPWLLNARVKLGTESIPGKPPGSPLALELCADEELLRKFTLDRSASGAILNANAR